MRFAPASRPARIAASEVLSSFSPQTSPDSSHVPTPISDTSMPVVSSGRRPMALPRQAVENEAHVIDGRPRVDDADPQHGLSVVARRHDDRGAGIEHFKRPPGVVTLGSPYPPERHHRELGLEEELEMGRLV